MATWRAWKLSVAPHHAANRWSYVPGNLEADPLGNFRHSCEHFHNSHEPTRETEWESETLRLPGVFR